jgi:hypothetical protein
MRSTVLIERHFLGFAPSYTVAYRRWMDKSLQNKSLP